MRGHNVGFELDEVRHRLAELCGLRLHRPFSVAEQHEYRALAERERELLGLPDPEGGDDQESRSSR